MTSTHPTTTGRRLVLVGAGHAHVEVLRSFAMDRPPDVSVTVVSPHSYATYSGMVPGVLAGQYDLRQAQIDARALAARAGAAFLPTTVVAVDAGNKLLRCDGYPDLPYDLVSFDIGSRPAGADRIAAGAGAVLVKPIEVAARDLDAALARGGGDGAAVVVGAGPGGVEIAFAIAARRAARAGSTVAVCDGAERPVGERDARTSATVERAFATRGIRFVGGSPVTAVDQHGVRLGDGSVLPAELVVWATGAAAPPLFADSGLAVDERGFLAVGDDLRSVADKSVFAAGDCATLIEYPNLAKAGVYAVRQGPILAANLRAALAGRRLRRFRPQSGFLSLLNTGDGKAILSYRGLAWHGRLAWWLKDSIDRRFVRRYARPRLAPPDAAMGPMIACGGCAAKVGADVLERVLARLDLPTAPHVDIGLAEADDAAAFRPPDGDDASQRLASVVTADLFPPFADDLYLVGRVAAVNAASDLYAMGAEGAAAVALVAVPGETPRDQEAALEALLRGAAAALEQMGIPLVGGHTIAADHPLIGFSMHGFASSGQLLRKSGARVGDALILGKPLGTGVVLAAARAGVADSDWVEACYASMLRSNRTAMRLIRAHGARACTDITGFGLLGHLGDLARHSGVGAEIERAAIPVLPGAAELLARGWRSSFHAGNERAHGGAADPLLVDPQTSGGLLAAVPAERVEALLGAAGAADEPLWVIGRLVDGEPGAVRAR